MPDQDESLGPLVPRPDPSILTTEQLHREIGALRELIEARLSGNAEAVVLLRTSTDKIPAAIDSAVRQLEQRNEEKFRSIALQFAERDTRTEQTSRDSKVAVDAALQAAKEAVGEQNKSNALAIAKSEAAFTKQIDQIGLLIQSGAKGTDDKIDDIKTRLTTIEGQSKGRGDLAGWIFGGVGMVAALIAIIAAVVQH